MPIIVKCAGRDTSRSRFLPYKKYSGFMLQSIRPSKRIKDNLARLSSPIKSNALINNNTVSDNFFEAG